MSNIHTMSTDPIYILKWADPRCPDRDQWVDVHPCHQDMLLVTDSPDQVCSLFAEHIFEWRRTVSARLAIPMEHLVIEARP